MSMSHESTTTYFHHPLDHNTYVSLLHILFSEWHDSMAQFVSAQSAHSARYYYISTIRRVIMTTTTITLTTATCTLYNYYEDRNNNMMKCLSD